MTRYDDLRRMREARFAAEKKQRADSDPLRVCLYRHFDQGGRLLYVGATSNPLQRLTNHKYAASWFDRIARIEIERHPTLEAALAAEAKAIKTEKPEFNIVALTVPPRSTPRSRPTLSYARQFPLRRRPQLP